MAVIYVWSENGQKELDGLEKEKEKAHERMAATEKGDFLERQSDREVDFKMASLNCRGGDNAIPLKTDGGPRVKVGFQRRWMHFISIMFNLKRKESVAARQKRRLVNTRT